MSLVPQLGFGELLLLAVLALVVVGPKDLPRLMHGLGRAVGQLRKLADEFRASFDQMAREAEMEELRAEIDALKKSNPVNEVKGAFDEARDDVMRALPDEDKRPNG
ncbi:Sec-independent protein translocase protein TatB [Parvularcula oceani]|uniref:Sec-independent protein translocase protein TatB n=1 Tax=Parvularcula oceani TaxID=1247963 RepID=UPI00068976A8|nr:Sec-independent protein translocase protein TatB [Parvularcula oceani]